MMRRIKLVVAYDGTNYCGWQTQPGCQTVEGVINEKLSELLDTSICVIGASRTDSGVHADGNVCCFDTESRIPGEKFAYALNARLPEDIVVVRSEEVDENFHPRRNVLQKTYEYRIEIGTFQSPMGRLYASFLHNKLDVEKMQKAAAYLVGEHDFTSFCSVKTEIENHIRTIFDIDIREEKSGGLGENEFVVISVTGSGFLYNMVRIIAGTLINVGLGRIEPDNIQMILEAKDREKAGPTAVAKGLKLKEIVYNENILL